jgi:hypothetical protein
MATKKFLSKKAIDFIELSYRNRWRGELLNIFKKSLSAEYVSSKIVKKIYGELCIIKPKLERLFKTKISETDLAAALTSIYIFQIADIGSSKDKQEILKLSVNNLYNNFLGLGAENGTMRDWVDKFRENNGDYAACIHFLNDRLNDANGESDDVSSSIFPFVGMLYEKLTGAIFENTFKKNLMSSGGSEWLNELCIICGSVIFDARDFIIENKF